jgi:hypothetical protein
LKIIPGFNQSKKITITTIQSQTCYIASMNLERNLANPDFEPTDAQLQELTRAAFAHVQTAHQESLDRLRLEIAQARVLALQRISHVLSEAF